MINTSITAALGAGSGIDTVALIESLTSAVRTPQQALIDRRSQLNTARISTIATISAAVDSFASSLQDLISVGTLRKAATVSDPSILSATVVPGGRPTTTSARLTVDAIARGQVVTSQALTSAAEEVGKGDLTITTHTGSVTVHIDDTNNSLTGLASTINAANSGVTASVVTDADGARLVMRGADGAANAFSIVPTPANGSSLDRFGYPAGSGLVLAQSASDALLKLDGVALRRTSNSVRDLIDGVEINLLQAHPGVTVTVGLTNPTSNIQSGISDFVSAFNQVKQQLDTALSAVDGPLRGNDAMAGLRRSLGKLPTTALVTAGSGPSTLAEIGVRTNRDGSLSIDSARLSSILASDPDGVEALFNPAQYSSSSDVVIRSAPGRVRPGTYTLTNLVAQNGSTPSTGLIDGVAATSVGRNLVAPPGSPALGLIVAVNANVATATITIEPGLGGALDSIRDSLRSSSGPLATTQLKLTKETSAISKDQDGLDNRLRRYRDQLTRSYASMDGRVASFRATQSYLSQQIAGWNKSTN